MHRTKPQPLAGAPREYRIVQDVPMLGLRVGDMVLFKNDRYTLHRRLTTDPAVLWSALAAVSLFIEAPLDPTARPTGVIQFPAKPRGRAGVKAKRPRKAAP